MGLGLGVYSRFGRFCASVILVGERKRKMTIETAASRNNSGESPEQRGARWDERRVGVAGKLPVSELVVKLIQHLHGLLVVLQLRLHQRRELAHLLNLHKDMHNTHRGPGSQFARRVPCQKKPVSGSGGAGETSAVNHPLAKFWLLIETERKGP